jgi:predicted DNA-binding transcriptional regulator YafY
MKKRNSGGDKRSSWQTFHRRLWLVRRLIRGPARSDALIADARREFGDAEIYPPNASGALRHDLAALRDEFGCVINYDQRNGYCLEGPGELAILDLPDDELEGLAYLASTFSEGTMPNALVIERLLDRISGLLPSYRREQLQHYTALPRFEQPRTKSPSAPLLRQLKRVNGKQEITFEYLSSYAHNHEPVRHRVQPYDILFREGHTYLEAYCVECTIAEIVSRYNLYRLDRIVEGSIDVLPKRLPPGRPARPRYHLRYRLAAQVVRRRDFAHWFPNSTVEDLDNGDVVIQTNVYDLWQARQILLRYREHCTVLEPPELVQMMQETISRMSQVYQQSSETRNATATNT